MTVGLAPSFWWWTWEALANLCNTGNIWLLSCEIFRSLVLATGDYVFDFFRFFSIWNGKNFSLCIWSHVWRGSAPDISDCKMSSKKPEVEVCCFFLSAKYLAFMFFSKKVEKIESFWFFPFNFYLESLMLTCIRKKTRDQKLRWIYYLVTSLPVRE